MSAPLPPRVENITGPNLRIDTWVELVRLDASWYGCEGSMTGCCPTFGEPVAMSGTAVVAGMWDNCGPYGVLPAWLFVKPKDGWSTWNSTGPDVQLGYGTGQSPNIVAVSGSTAVVGDGFFQSPGAALVFVKPKRGWKRVMSVTATLTPSNGKCDPYGDCVPQLGASAAISGDTVVAGAPCSVVVGTGCGPGAAYVFARPARGWVNMTENAILTASDGRENDDLGWFVAISGNTVVAYGGGAEYVFVRPVRGWRSRTQTSKLTVSDGSGLGSVAISGDTVAAIAGDGAVYVYVKPKSGWANMTETAKLTASDGSALDSVSISGNTVAATGGGAAGSAAYVFVKPASGWVNMTETAKLTPSDGTPLEGVSISGSTLVAGAQGAAYVFGQSQ